MHIDKFKHDDLSWFIRMVSGNSCQDKFEKNSILWCGRRANDYYPHLGYQSIFGKFQFSTTSWFEERTLMLDNLSSFIEDEIEEQFDPTN